MRTWKVLHAHAKLLRAHVTREIISAHVTGIACAREVITCARDIKKILEPTFDCLFVHLIESIRSESKIVILIL